MPWVEATFAVVVWGSTFIATKVALREVSPAGVVWLRFAIGVVVLGATVAIRRQRTLPTWRELGYFTLLGFIGITFHQWLQSTGLVTSQASTTAWIVSTIPVFMALLGWIFLRERLGGLQIGGIALAGVGTACYAPGPLAPASASATRDTPGLQRATPACHNIREPPHANPDPLVVSGHLQLCRRKRNPCCCPDSL